MAKKKKSEDDTEEKPKGGKLKIIIGAVVLLATGAGGAYGAVAAGLIGETAEEAGPDLPKLIKKGEEDPYAPAGGKGDKDGGAGAAVFGEGGSEYRTVYYRFEEGFTSNLKNSPGLVQVSLAASTRHDGRVIQWLERHQLALRSAILVQLAATEEEAVFTPEGKNDLQERLTKALNDVLIEQEGFGGVESVHFQSFIVQ
ncbi:flagellar basal body-associated FliL family protein [Qipengyuania sp. DGS5-3]|uniref:flagellar basal body-associated FliL family protein n=1 Tax=Qipengyuania sp. DGS5-3 TaxID=3349632 RepID=UPI0036D3EED7